MDALAREKMMAPGTAYRYTAPRTLAAMFAGVGGGLGGAIGGSVGRHETTGD